MSPAMEQQAQETKQEREGARLLSAWLEAETGRMLRLAFVLSVSSNAIWTWASGRRVPDPLHQRMLRLALNIAEESWLNEREQGLLKRCSAELERGALAA